MTELRAETTRAIDTTQEGIDRSLRTIEARLKATEDNMEILVFWKDMIVRIVFGILVLCSILSFLDVSKRFFGA
jgi:hypothetical protein